MLVGALLLPLEPLMSAEWYGSFRLTAIGVVLAFLLLAAVITYAVVYSRRRWKDGGSYFMPPQRGIAVSDLDPEGQIKARGELWLARSDDGSKNYRRDRGRDCPLRNHCSCGFARWKILTDTNNDTKEA